MSRHQLFRWLSIANLVGNCVIVITGAFVRISDSGLGCPTWPRCTQDSFSNTSSYGIHGYIEFGNRVLAGVLVALIVLAAIIQQPRRRSLVTLTLAQAAGLVAQAGLGGLTVLTQLNSWLVGAHFALSIVIIYGAYALVARINAGDQPKRYTVVNPIRWLVYCIVFASAASIVIGVMVTGAGPHAGDSKAARNGLPLTAITQLHSDAVLVLLGLTAAAVFASIAISHRKLRQALLELVVAEIIQAAIGFTQYYLDLPKGLVLAHVAGSVFVWLATMRILFALHTRDNTHETTGHNIPAQENKTSATTATDQPVR